MPLVKEWLCYTVLMMCSLFLVDAAPLYTAKSVVLAPAEGVTPKVMNLSVELNAFSTLLEQDKSVYGRIRHMELPFYLYKQLKLEQATSIRSMIVYDFDYPQGPSGQPLLNLKDIYAQMKDVFLPLRDKLQQRYILTLVDSYGMGFLRYVQLLNDDIMTAKLSVDRLVSMGTLGSTLSNQMNQNDYLMLDSSFENFSVLCRQLQLFPHQYAAIKSIKVTRDQYKACELSQAIHAERIQVVHPVPMSSDASEQVDLETLVADMKVTLDSIESTHTTSIQMVDENQFSLLHLSILAGKWDLFDVLIQNRAVDVNQVTKEGMSAIAMCVLPAVYLKSKENAQRCFKELMNKGANLKVEFNRGHDTQTLFDLFALVGEAELMEQVQQHGLDMPSLDEDQEGVRVGEWAMSRCGKTLDEEEDMKSECSEYVIAPVPAAAAVHCHDCEMASWTLLDRLGRPEGPPPGTPVLVPAQGSREPSVLELPSPKQGSTPAQERAVPRASAEEEEVESGQEKASGVSFTLLKRRSLRKRVQDKLNPRRKTLLQVALSFTDEDSSILSKYVKTVSLAGLKEAKDGLASALVGKGASPFVRDGEGNSAFHVAVKQGLMQTVARMLDVHGAALFNVLNAQGESGLMVAVESQNAEMSMLLLGYEPSVEQLDVHTERWEVQAGPPARGAWQLKTALWAALMSGQFEVAEKLLQMGSRAFVYDMFRSAALSLRRDQRRVAKWLLVRGVIETGLLDVWYPLSRTNWENMADVLRLDKSI